MKKNLVILFGMGIAAHVLADVDVGAGVKLYGVLDQAVQSQSLSDSISATAGQNMSVCTLRYQPADWVSELSVS
jgi:hypothetical protein